ncbi:MAG: hypothetical protein WCO26_14805 [Deltaproteobacteria bacterium]
METKKKASLKKTQKELILKALTDASFRKLLTTDPANALGKKITPHSEKEVKMVLAVVKGIDAQISHLADELLCANGGPCGIA